MSSQAKRYLHKEALSLLKRQHYEHCQKDKKTHKNASNTTKEWKINYFRQYSKNNRETISRYKKIYAMENVEKIIAGNKFYYQKNKNKLTEMKRQHRTGKTENLFKTKEIELDALSQKQYSIHCRQVNSRNTQKEIMKWTGRSNPSESPMTSMSHGTSEGCPTHRNLRWKEWRVLHFLNNVEKSLGIYSKEMWYLVSRRQVVFLSEESITSVPTSTTPLRQLQ
eukprot:TRINITY_DN2966_c0_g1_i5.p1 TRINITY_DN2966_c0_g1~~TRINITY_DN2966_c0_g1_i5.p1  ORF type:complete len:223 (+),score=27.70 TRINITY_DN2966_c0_g1_i5:413-1081(+)